MSVTPDAARHNPDPLYLRRLLDAAGLSQRQAAARLGLTERAMRYYLSAVGSAGYRPAPYPVQFALERLAAAGAPPVLPVLEVAVPELLDWRALSDADVRAQAPVGLEWEAARSWVEGQVAQRYSQLPCRFCAAEHDTAQAAAEQHARGFCAVHRDPATVDLWPREAIEPARFAAVMAARREALGDLGQAVAQRLPLLQDMLQRQRYPITRYAAAARARGLLEAWEGLGLLEAQPVGELSVYVALVAEQAEAQLAEQLQAGDLAVLPWSGRPGVRSMAEVDELAALPRAEAAFKPAQQKADGELLARHCERQAAQLLQQAKAWREGLGDLQVGA